uniref:Scaffolding anchor of CK1 domain-containing protein n=1 Tax=Neogobius melanostomus TaxID=47308 RepID=A0A8C6SJG3_9GOBI
MDANSISQWQRKVTPQGKVRRRVQELRIPSSSSFDFWAGRPLPDLSHNESARLAVDGFLSQGLEGYHAALKTEGEVDFLSEHEKKYFLENRSHTEIEPDADAGDGSDMESEKVSSSTRSATQCPSVSKDSDTAEVGLRSKEDEDGSFESNEPNVEAYFNTEKKAAGLKDVVREFIRKAQKSLAIVTDRFSDVELLCDLLEASKKRWVSVHLLLDHLNLNIFRDMWQELKLQGKDFPKFSVHSVEGQTFCTQTGRKLHGQISEMFIIADWTEALTGSFSFSWLSWLVHRNLAFHVKGSAVRHFLQEFERLSSCSTPMPGFTNVPFTLPIKTQPNKNADRQRGKITSGQTDVVHIWDWIEDGLNSHTKKRTQINILTPQFSRTPRQPVMQHMCMEKFRNPALPVQDKGDILHKPHSPRNSQYQNNWVPYSHSPQNGATTGKNIAVIKGAARSNPALLTHRQDKTVGSGQNKDFNDRNPHVAREDYWDWRQSRTVMTPPGIAAGINKLREERYTSQIKSNPSNNPKVMHCFMSQEKSEQCVQSHINSSQGATYRLQTAVKSNGIKTLNQSPRHNFLQSHTMRSPTTSISIQPKLESNFTPATRNMAALEPKVLSQVKPSPRLAWMTQNNTVRSGHATRPVSFYAYDTVQKMDGQTQFHNASTKSLARSKSMTEKPGTSLNFK